jgi:hypothetical protein
VFISYVHEDSENVDLLQALLEDAGILVWRDDMDLWPGENWPATIQKAITENALVFLACFSSRSVARKQSYQNEELRLAIDQLRRRQPDDPWLIPVRFDECDVPDFELWTGRTLSSIHRADLFGPDRDIAGRRLVSAIQRLLNPGVDVGERDLGLAKRVDVSGLASSRSRLPLRAPVVRLESGEDVSPATLLRPRHAVVSYVGRAQLLGDLAEWCKSDGAEPDLQLWFITGAGGFGKTRLAVEACLEAEARGWKVGLLRPVVSDAAVRELAEWQGPLLIAVDYAETRPALVGRLAEELIARPNRWPVRMLLLVRRRAARGELLAMFNEHSDEEFAALLRHANLFRLDGAASEVDRASLFERALTDFGAWFGSPSLETGHPQLDGDHFSRPLYVLVAALLSRVSPGTDVDSLGEQELLRELLTGHEARYWASWAARRGLVLDPDDQRAAVAVATLLGAQGDDEAITVARLVPHLGDVPEPQHTAIARWLAQLYPAFESQGVNGQISIGPLEPDRLGEVLVGDVLRQYPHLLTAAIAAASDRQLTQALTVCARIAQTDEIIRAQLSAALNVAMPDIVRRGLHVTQ